MSNVNSEIGLVERKVGVGNILLVKAFTTSRQAR